jgi:nucleolar pre-ribosomal-associated protein 1
MSKRTVDADDGNQAYLKRQKISHVAPLTAVEEIRSSRQLQQLLAFDQDTGRAKHGMYSTAAHFTLQFLS